MGGWRLITARVGQIFLTWASWVARISSPYSRKASLRKIGDQTKQANMEWVWLPIPNGNHPEGEVHQSLLDAMPRLSHLLDEGNSLFIHCSAGIHRTGMIAYGLLRWRGMEQNEALTIIRMIREETADGRAGKTIALG